ncbi:MAG: DUF3179 domain-containing (seleno)protein [Pseudomonadota bacterium]
MTLARILFALACLLATPAHAQSAAGDAPALPDYIVERFGTPPAIPTGPLSPEVEDAIRVVFVDSLERSRWGEPEQEALAVIAASGDPRLAWIIADMMRFTWRLGFDNALAQAASALTGLEFNRPRRWGILTDHLIAWDIPAPPDYLDTKRAIFTRFLPGLEGIFVEGDLDWRIVSWGGVLIDDRVFGDPEICNCIPAADNPDVSSAADADWLADEAIVFGLVINGEARAYPRRIMEVREMVNDTLGGRDLGIPYCTLCGAAQAYFTDAVPEGVARPILRTSGLLSRSNKVMYDLNTRSVFDTFLGHAVTGPLAEAGVALPRAGLVTTTWGDWKRAHPETTVLVEALALGRDFNFREGRDAAGPIFPVGDVDPRLEVQDDVIGALTASGTPVAFPHGAALLALRDGREVRFQDIEIVLTAGGLKAQRTDGSDPGGHDAFWFAWSQFHPDTAVWQPL